MGMAMPMSGNGGFLPTLHLPLSMVGFVRRSHWNHPSEWTWSTISHPMWYSLNKSAIPIAHGWTVQAWCWAKEANHKRPHIVWFDLYDLFKIGKFIETEDRIGVTVVWEEGTMGSYCVMGAEFLFGVIKMFWKWIAVMVCDFVYYYHWIVPSKMVKIVNFLWCVF